MAIPQAYVEAGTTKYSMKFGHFYTPHGYMVVQAIGNFFNTQPFGFMMTNPFTHWGGMGSAQLTDQLLVTAGIVNGWDALDRPVNNAAFMGGIKYSFKEDKGFFSTNVITGQEPENLGTAYAQRTLVTNVLDWKPTKKFEFVLENNFGVQENHGIGNSWFYNFVPYLFYKVNDCWRVGIRYEFFHDPGNFTAAERVGNPNNGPIPANVISGPYFGNFQTIAVGLNWWPRASKNLTIRPELRYDWFDGTGVGGGPFNAGQNNHQIMMMVGGIYQF